MLYSTPPIAGHLGSQLDELESLRLRLGPQSRQHLRWMGTLRRLMQTAAVENSTAIEGFSVPEGEALSLVTGEASPGSDTSRQAIACYARAMDHVGAMANDPEFEWSKRVLLDLHFDTCHFQPDKAPGRWREGAVSVVGGDGRIVYRAPDASDVPGLMGEVVDWIENGDRDAPAVIRAAMAHFHVVAVHPFRDGNGRVSRIVQSLVLARDGLVAPEFASIEEYLGTHTAEYYAALAAVQGGRYRPERDATPWIELCVRAHLEQARDRLAQIERAADRWGRLEELAEARDWPDRLVIALEQGLVGGSDRSRYAHEADVSSATASVDLRRLVDAGLLLQTGRGPSSRYEATDQLRKVAGEDEA